MGAGIYGSTLLSVSKPFSLLEVVSVHSDVYRAFQPLEQQGFINQGAHNDYLELMFDMGLAGMVIIGDFFLLYLYGWVKLWDNLGMKNT